MGHQPISSLVYMPCYSYMLNALGLGLSIHMHCEMSRNVPSSQSGNSPGYNQSLSSLS